MSPLMFAGVGWILGFLGTSVPGIGFAAPLGAAFMVVGLMRIRWRSQSLAASFWASVALLVSLVVIMSGLYSSVVLVLAVVLLQTGVGVGMATGVHECLTAAPGDTPQAKIDQLRLARTLVIATIGGTVLAAAFQGAGLAPPPVSMLLLFVATLSVHIWLGVLLISLRAHPAVQEHSTRRR
jgi:hypothetical protein